MEQSSTWTSDTVVVVVVDIPWAELAVVERNLHSANEHQGQNLVAGGAVAAPARTRRGHRYWLLERRHQEEGPS